MWEREAKTLKSGTRGNRFFFFVCVFVFVRVCVCVFVIFCLRVVLFFVVLDVGGKRRCGEDWHEAGGRSGGKATCVEGKVERR